MASKTPKSAFPLRLLALPQPSTGSQLASFTIDQHFWTRIVLFKVLFTASAAAGNRRPRLSVGDGTGGLLWQFSHSSTITANFTNVVTYTRGEIAPTPLVGIANGDDINVRLGTDLVPPGMTVTLNVDGLDAGDAILAPRLIVATLDTRPVRSI